MLNVLRVTRVPQIFRGFFLMFPSISYEHKIKVVRHDAQHTSHKLSCFHSWSIRWTSFNSNTMPPRQVPPKPLHSEQVVFSIEEFPALPISISPQLSEYAESSAHIRISFQTRLKWYHPDLRLVITTPHSLGTCQTILSTFLGLSCFHLTLPLANCLPFLYPHSTHTPPWHPFRWCLWILTTLAQS